MLSTTEIAKELRILWIFRWSHLVDKPKETVYTEQVRMAVTLCIWELLFSNVGGDTGYPDFLMRLLGLFIQILEILSSAGHDRYLYNPFQLTSHHA
jgi:hypothetical protein